jgi:WhiB family redox-sensing transcriptional regulator
MTRYRRGADPFPVGSRNPPEPKLACQRHDPDLWFAESPADTARAQALCAGCPVRAECLAGALARGEPYGVWGGEIVQRGTVVAAKHQPGRPRKERSGAAA